MLAVVLFIKQLLVFSVEYQPVVENFDVVVLWLICYILLVGCGLLLACLSPPGMDLELQVLLHGFVG
jgi:hypothetical protein